MNVFTAKEPGAAGLVALARPGGDPATMTPPRASDARRHASRRPWRDASQRVIAAAPRHARQQLTPALMGVG